VVPLRGTAKSSVPLRGAAKDRCRFDAPREFGATSKHCEKIVPLRGASSIGADSRHLREVRCYFKALQKSVPLRGTYEKFGAISRRFNDRRSFEALRRVRCRFEALHDRCRRRHYEQIGATSSYSQDRCRLEALQERCRFEALRNIAKDRCRFEALRSSVPLRGTGQDRLLFGGSRELGSSMRDRSAPNCRKRCPRKIGRRFPSPERVLQCFSYPLELPYTEKRGAVY